MGKTTIFSATKRFSWAGCALFVVALGLVGGCDNSEPPSIKAETPEVTALPPAQNGSAQALWQSGDRILTASLETSQQLHHAISRLLDTPDQTQLLAAQKAWHKAAFTYQEFSLFAYLKADNSSLFKSIGDYHYRIAAHPVQPGYLDAFGDYLYSGIVHDISMPLNKQTLIDQHGMTDLEDASLGFYAMEYMLFGYQNTRTSKDYLAYQELTSEHQKQGFQNIKEVPANRRRQLLKLQNDILQEDLQRQADHWRNSPLSNEWLTLSPSEHYSATVHAFKQATSVLLLEVIKDAKSDASPTELADTTNTNQASQAATQAKESELANDRIKMSLVSLRHALPVFPEEISRPLTTALDTAIQAADTNQTEWHKIVYEQLMTLSRADFQLQ